MSRGEHLAQLTPLERRLQHENAQLRKLLAELGEGAELEGPGRPPIAHRIRRLVLVHQRIVVAYDAAYDAHREDWPGEYAFNAATPWLVEVGHGRAIRCGGTLEKALVNAAEVVL